MTTTAGEANGVADFDRPRRPRVEVVSLAEYGAMLRRRWKTIAAAVLLGILLGAGLYLITPPSYEARTEMTLLPLPGQNTASSSRVDGNTLTELNIAQNPSVTDIARRTMAAHYPQYGEMRTGEMAKKRTIKNPTSSQTLEFIYRAGNANEAADGANALADAYLTFRSEEAKRLIDDEVTRIGETISMNEGKINQLLQIFANLDEKSPQRGKNQTERASLTARNDELGKDIDKLRSTSTSAGRILGRANPPARPSAPRLSIFGMGGLLLGLIAGIALALRREHRDDQIRGPGDVTRAGASPQLATIRVPRRVPTGSGMAVLTAATSPEAEGYRVLAAKLQASHLHAGRRLLFTGSHGGDARVPINTAIALARMGKPTLLIGAQKTLAQALSTVGLAADWASQAGPGGVVDLVEVPNLSLAALPQDDLTTIMELITESDPSFVLIDDSTNPAAWRTLSLATAVDGVVLTAMIGRNGRRALKRLCDELASVHSQLLGSVLLVAGRSTPAPPATKTTRKSESKTPVKDSGKSSAKSGGKGSKKDEPVVPPPPKEKSVESLAASDAPPAPVADEAANEQYAPPTPKAEVDTPSSQVAAPPSDDPTQEENPSNAGAEEAESDDVAPVEADSPPAQADDTGDTGSAGSHPLRPERTAPTGGHLAGGRNGKTAAPHFPTGEISSVWETVGTASGTAADSTKSGSSAGSGSGRESFQWPEPPSKTSASHQDPAGTTESAPGHPAGGLEAADVPGYQPSWSMDSQWSPQMDASPFAPHDLPPAPALQPEQLRPATSLATQEPFPTQAGPRDDQVSPLAAPALPVEEAEVEPETDLPASPAFTLPSATVLPGMSEPGWQPPSRTEPVNEQTPRKKSSRTAREGREGDDA